MPETALDQDELAIIPLSPSRVAEFKTCPKLYEFRFIQQLPEPIDPSAARGTLVHAVLESLFQIPSQERTLIGALKILDVIWETLKNSEEMAGLSIGPDDESLLLANAHMLLHNYFMIEDPRAIEPEQLEWWVEHAADKLFLRGIIDRVDVLPDGEWVLTDYKTGRSPSDMYALGSFFGLKFYALVCWRAFNKLPKMLRLIQMREPEVLTLIPSAQMLEGLERQLEAVGDAIVKAHVTGDWRPRPNRFCGSCAHISICPAFVGSEHTEAQAVAN